MLLAVPKKAKTPRAPRSVQAPKRRTDPRRGSPLSALPRWSWAVAGATVVALAVVAAFAFGRGSSGSSTSEAAVAKAMTAAGCTYKSVPPKPPKKDPSGTKGGYHADVPALSTPTKNLWSTFPPSGGAHYGLWAVWGFYRSPVNPRQVVHNEEHGGVVIWWGPDVPSSTVGRLEKFYEEKPEGMVGTPLAGLDGKIALTAWTGDPTKYYRGNYGTGHLAVCRRFDEKAFATFRDAFRGKGPEGIPLSSDAPGSGPQ
jgi:Protein of unknown function (DUF3105)